MRVILAAVSLVIGALVTGACAPVGPDAGPGERARAPRQCFSAQQIRNFRSDRDETLYVRSSDDQVFHLSTSGFCRDLGSANAVAIVSETGGSQVCVDDYADVALPNRRGAEQCRARIVSRLTEAELAALPSRLRP